MTQRSEPAGIASNRVPWGALPASLRAAVEARAGHRVEDAASGAAGFSPGYAGVLRLDDGSRIFVKAGDGATNPEVARLHAREAVVAAGLPAGLSPRFEWSFAHEGWVVLAFEAIEGRQPGAPWTDADLDAVLEAQRRLAARPAPAVLEPLAERHAETFTGWSGLVADGRLGAAPDWARERIDRLVALEGEPVARAAAGDAIVHLDLRSDNVLIGDAGARIVDWPHAGLGAPWLDLVFFAPTVALEGGAGDAEAVFARSPLAASAGREELLAIVAGWSGWLLRASLNDPPPGIPTLRAFQAAQAGAALPWLRRLLGA